VPRHKRTQANQGIVDRAARSGMTLEQCAILLDIDPTIIHKYYAKQWQHGRTEAILEIAESMFKRAKEGEFGAQCFILKSQGGWWDRPPAQIKTSWNSALNIHGPPGQSKVSKLKIVFVDPPPRSDDDEPTLIPPMKLIDHSHHE
jgi:hypothetical protein